MKVTAIIKDKDESFYLMLEEFSHKAAFEYLNKNAYGIYPIPGLKIKTGSGTFKDRVELNRILRNENCITTYKRELRRGYYLITFDFN